MAQPNPDLSLPVLGHGGPVGNFTAPDAPDYGEIVNCMHCGLCLPSCPTYALTGLEKHSPRGRIQLMKAVADGELGLTPGFVDSIDFCLNCRACETACPAGVKYGELVGATRAQIEQLVPPTATARVLKRVLLKGVFLRHGRLKLVARGLRLTQRLRLPELGRKTGVLRFISKKLAEIEPLSPTIPVRFSDADLPEILPAYGETKYRVGFLTGCLMNVMLPEINLDTVEVLRLNGCEVVTPPDQRCCGSLHGHNGDLTTGRELARHAVDTFSRYDLDALVMNSAGCGSFLMEYGHLLAAEPAYAERAARLSAMTVDLTVFLDRIGFAPPTAAPTDTDLRATYHDACHLCHGQKVTREPRAVLGTLPGVDWAPLGESTWCCGSAGIYNLTHTDASMQLLDRKMGHVAATGATTVVTGNPGCLLQIRHGVTRAGLTGVEVLHPATLLRRAYDRSDSPS